VVVAVMSVVARDDNALHRMVSYGFLWFLMVSYCFLKYITGGVPSWLLYVRLIDLKIDWRPHPTLTADNL